VATRGAVPSLIVTIPDRGVEVFKEGFVKEGEIIQKGFIPIPERAGLGVEMDDEFVRKAQIPGTPWFVPD
jgi:L-alanine-DL-glutamate epimerase-like enolase superfamily enzyme